MKLCAWTINTFLCFMFWCRCSSGVRTLDGMGTRRTSMALLHKLWIAVQRIGQSKAHIRTICYDTSGGKILFLLLLYKVDNMFVKVPFLNVKVSWSMTNNHFRSRIGWNMQSLKRSMVISTVLDVFSKELLISLVKKIWTKNYSLHLQNLKKLRKRYRQIVTSTSKLSTVVL